MTKVIKTLDPRLEIQDRSYVQPNPLAGGNKQPLLDETRKREISILIGRLDKGHFDSVLQSVRNNPDWIKYLAALYSNQNTSPKIKERSRMVLEKICRSDVDITSSLDLLIAIGFGGNIKLFSSLALGRLVDDAMNPETRDVTLSRIFAGLKGAEHISFSSAKVLGILAEKELDVSAALPDIASLLDNENSLLRSIALNAIGVIANQEWGREKALAALEGSISSDNRSLSGVIKILDGLADCGLYSLNAISRLLVICNAHSPGDNITVEVRDLVNKVVKSGADISPIMRDMLNWVINGLDNETFWIALSNSKSRDAAIKVIMEIMGDLDCLSRLSILKSLSSAAVEGADLSQLFPMLFYWAMVEDRPNGEDDRQVTLQMIDNVNLILIASVDADTKYPDAAKMNAEITKAIMQFSSSKVFMHEAERNTRVFHALVNCFNRVMTFVQAGTDGKQAISGSRAEFLDVWKNGLDKAEDDLFST